MNKDKGMRVGVPSLPLARANSNPSPRFDSKPSWIDDFHYHWLRTTESHDIDDPPAVMLAAVLGDQARQ